MKLRNYNWLAKSNIKRGNKNRTILILMLLCVISLTLIMSAAAQIKKTMDQSINIYWARKIELWISDDMDFSMDTLDEISKIDHVIGIEKKIWILKNQFTLHQLKMKMAKNIEIC